MPLLLRRVAAWVALAVLAVAGAVAATAASWDVPAEQDFHARTDEARVADGGLGLRSAADLTEVARRHSARMAAEGRLRHNEAIGEEVSGWQKVGENVGRGATVESVQDAFLASPSHRSTLLDRDYTEVGVGVTWRDSTLYVTVLFRQPAAEAAPKPAPNPSPKPPSTVPVARAAPAPASVAATTASTSSTSTTTPTMPTTTLPPVHPPDVLLLTAPVEVEAAVALTPALDLPGPLPATAVPAGVAALLVALVSLQLNRTVVVTARRR